jgi:hypothetical protein
MKIRFLATSFALCLTTTQSFSQNQDCSKALIVATDTASSSITTQLSLAYSISEGEWAEAKRNAAGNAVIYGVPVGASYSDYKSNVRQRAESFHLDRFEQRSFAYATSGLNEASLAAYKACLQTSEKGFNLVAGDMSDETYRIYLVNAPVPGLNSSISGTVQNPINVAAESLAFLKRSVSKLKYAESWDKPLLIQPNDPTKEVSFTIDFGDVVDKTLLLPPLKNKPARTEITNAGTFALLHRVQGVPRQDCALSTPEKGGEGGHPTDYVLNELACITTASKKLPASFKIDPGSVSISSPGQTCARVVCEEVGPEDAQKPGSSTHNSTECKPRPAATSYCFRVRLLCPNAYDVACTDDWKITGQAVEMKD